MQMPSFYILFWLQPMQQEAPGHWPGTSYLLYRLRLALLAHQSSAQQRGHAHDRQPQRHTGIAGSCLLYTSDAADEL